MTKPLEGNKRNGEPLDADADGVVDGLLKCDNHPDRDATNFTGGNAFSINLCPECTPRWFKTG